MLPLDLQICGLARTQPTAATRIVAVGCSIFMLFAVCSVLPADDSGERRVSIARKLPQFSIARLMAAVAMIAFVCLAYHIDLTDHRVWRLGHEYVIGVVPMASLLLFGLLVAGSDLWRRGECHPFAVGFELAGWASLFFYVSFMAINFENGRRWLDVILPTTQWFFRRSALIYADYDVLAFQTLLFFIPELVLAVIGGWATTSLNVCVSRRTQSQSSTF